MNPIALEYVAPATVEPWQPPALLAETSTVVKFMGQEVETVCDDRNEPWFVAADVCTILGLDDTRAALRPLGDDEKLTGLLIRSGQGREVWLVNEPGLYQLIFASRKPEAVAFRRWVCHVVLPTLRKQREAALTQQLQLTDAKLDAARWRLALLTARVAGRPELAEFIQTVLRQHGPFAGRKSWSWARAGHELWFWIIRHEQNVLRYRLDNTYMTAQLCGQWWKRCAHELLTFFVRVEPHPMEMDLWQMTARPQAESLALIEARARD